MGLHGSVRAIDPVAVGSQGRMMLVIMNAAAIPRMPIAPDGLLPPLPVLGAWLEEITGDTIALDLLPPDNAVLPACCAPYGIRRLILSAPPAELPSAFRWQSSDGSHLTVTAGPAQPEDPLPLLTGSLPASGGRRRSTRRAYAELLAATRLGHAATVVSGNQEGAPSSWASWDQLLEGLEGPTVAAPPALAVLQSLPLGHHSLTVWNPAPLRHACPLLLDARETDLPWSLRDETGRRHAVQVVEGPLGSQLLSLIPMAELSCCRLHLDDRPAGELPWEVSAQVLDNGRLRAEFTAGGALARLCVDGRFARLPRPLLADLALELQTVQVLEDGPVRARLLFTYGVAASGILRVVIGLQAGARTLDIVWTWTGDGDAPEFTMPVHPGDQVRLWQQGGPPRIVQTGEGRADREHRFEGIRMLQMSCADGSEPGLDLSGLGGATVTLAGDRLLVEADGGLRVLLGHGTAPGDLVQGEAWQRCEARVAPLDGDRPPPLFSDDPTLLQALWSHRDAKGRLRLLLAERRGRHGTMLLHLAKGRPELLVDGVWRELPADREAGWWRLDFSPGAILPLRCR